MFAIPVSLYVTPSRATSPKGRGYHMTPTFWQKQKTSSRSTIPIKQQKLQIIVNKKVPSKSNTSIKQPTTKSLANPKSFK